MAFDWMQFEGSLTCYYQLIIQLEGAKIPEKIVEFPCWELYDIEKS